MIKPAVKNENASDLPLQIETFRLPRLFPDDFFFSLIWCIVVAAFPRMKFLRKNTKQK
jgi:hypothetical protein